MGQTAHKLAKPCESGQHVAALDGCRFACVQVTALAIATCYAIAALASLIRHVSLLMLPIQGTGQ